MRPSSGGRLDLTIFSSHLSTSLSSFITSSKVTVGGFFCILLFQSIGLLDAQFVNERGSQPIEGQYAPVRCSCSNGRRFDNWWVVGVMLEPVPRIER